jgi:hypothetical protein
LAQRHPLRHGANGYHEQDGCDGEPQYGVHVPHSVGRPARRRPWK